MNQTIDMTPLNAVEFLRALHQQIHTVFADYAALNLSDDRLRERFVGYLSRDLLRYMMMEEDVFYPAVAAHIPQGERLVADAIASHQDMKQFIAKLESLTPRDEVFDATVKALSNRFDLHVTEDERGIFVLVSQTDLDLADLANDMRSAQQLQN